MKDLEVRHRDHDFGEHHDRWIARGCQSSNIDSANPVAADEAATHAS